MPSFGDWYTNTLASDDNPTQHGMYVDTITRSRGQVNPGTWWRLTDGCGLFWTSRPENLTPRAVTAMVDKLAEIARLLIVTESIESGGYDWERIDALLYDEGVAAWLNARAPRLFDFAAFADRLMAAGEQLATQLQNPKAEPGSPWTLQILEEWSEAKDVRDWLPDTEERDDPC